ncbi:DMT family transporter [Mobilicoccus caccae]|uniref:Transporter n=1 Tax=Mobilicoccus caccae TaxID=1859295 RepID=A0ABQ6IXI1_9MICO|nr:DMT family transporter [Mobilicoccus caccae]GMA42281.1 transporter [Mobilicoccus caccae]
MTPRLRGNLLLFLTAAIWGLAFVAQRVGAEHMGPFAFNGIRFGLGALSLLPVIVFFDHLRTARGGLGARRERTRAALLPGMAAGMILFTASWLQQWGLNWTTAGKAGFITGLYIVLVPIFGVFLRHRTGASTWVGALLALGGLYVLSVHGSLTPDPGDGLVLIGSLFWAAHILVVDRFTRLDALRFSAIQFATTSVLALVAALLFESDPFAGTGSALVPLFYGGVLSVGVAYTLQVFGQRDAAPAAAAIILSMEALFAALGGIIMLGEPLTWRELTGFSLMFAGILVSQRTPPNTTTRVPERPRRWRRRTHTARS